MVDEPTKDDRPRVLLTCATTGTLRRETVASIMGVMGNSRYRICLSMRNDRPYESALNRAAVTALTEDYDWWLHIDADQYWRGKPLDSLGEHDLVGFPAPIYHPGGGPGSPVMCFNAWHLTDPDDDSQVMPAAAEGKIKRVDIIGSGSFLLRVTALRESAIPAPFARHYDLSGVADRGPDLEFCRKWREAGLEIWADFSCPCGHFNTVDLIEVIDDMAMLQAQINRAETAKAPRVVRPSIRPV